MHFGGALSGTFGRDDSSPKAFAKNLRPHWRALWTFVHVDAFEPIDEAAERALRAAVLWRKGSLGTQNDAGNGFVARMLIVVLIARRRDIPLLD